jgi:hypothetical protein
MWQVDGTLFFVPVGSETLGGPIPAIVSNEMNSTQIVPIAPQRVLDTRTPAGRAHIVDLGALDSAGRLRADVWMHLDLTSLGSIFSAVVANLTVTGTTGTGWVAVTAVPTGPPSTSAINFTRGQTVANGLTSGVDPNAGTVSFWANMATHVIFDVTALNAPSPRYVPGALATPSSVRFQRAHAEMIARTSGFRSVRWCGQDGAWQTYQRPAARSNQGRQLRWSLTCRGRRRRHPVRSWREAGAGSATTSSPRGVASDETDRQQRQQRHRCQPAPTEPTLRPFPPPQRSSPHYPSAPWDPPGSPRIVPPDPPGPPAMLCASR